MDPFKIIEIDNFEKEIRESKSLSSFQEKKAFSLSPKKRRTVTRELVLRNCEEIRKEISKEIRKNLQNRFLSLLEKKMERLQKDIKITYKQKRKRKGISGFTKKVGITRELSLFANLDIESKYSRADITKIICEYIKKNSLFNPKDKREIYPDKKLSLLLDSDEEKIDYPRIQVLIQKRFLKE